MRIFTRFRRMFLVGMAAILFAPFCYAGGWERVLPLTGVWGLHITKQGTMLASSYTVNASDGIYYSDDRGTTWVRAEVEDHNYTAFFETDDYIFALGYGCYMARSADGGHTWSVIDYRNLMEGIIASSDLDYTACYAMTQKDGVLYAADFAGGVIFSEDKGDTWQHAEDSFFVVDNGGKGTTHQVIYNIDTINDRILAFGLYEVYEYFPEFDKWTTLRYDSNCMSVSVKHKGELYCARAIENSDAAVPFIEHTADGDYWSFTNRPEGLDNNYVRAMGSDGKRLVVGTIRNGIYHSHDDGETWESVDPESFPQLLPDIPELADLKLPILNIRIDADYIYVAAYASEYETNTFPGVYRFPLADLTLVPESVDKVTLDNAASATDDAYTLDGRRADAANSRGIVVTKQGKIIQ